MEETYPIENLIIKRWSARAMSGEAISKKELFSLFEAARNAPSSYNSQPWRFIYAFNNTPYWDPLYNLLVDFNKSWVKLGSVLIMILSMKNFEKNNKFSRTHSFDTGAAWENLALQAYSMGLVVHGLSGFDYKRAELELKIPEHFSIEAMCVIGKPGKIENLPSEIQKEEKRREKKPISELISEGIFKF